MTPALLDAITRQIGAEFAAAFSYLSMAAWCEHRQFMGAGRWLRLQSAEELGHGTRLLDFVLARNHAVRLPGIDQPRSEFPSIVEVFETALAQEEQVSRQIDALYELAFHEKVFAAMAELQWFITEQVEEEKTTREIVAKLHMVRDDPASLLDLDRELGTRRPEDDGEGGEHHQGASRD
ncbi:MAG: ferritin [Acidobacteria bacterium]|nr:ferritin [Acidobacteriota bacterium]